MTARVAICSSYNDRRLRARLYKHLAMLLRAGHIEICGDCGRGNEGVPGRGLEAADLILLLVSADFLSSNHCYNILARKALRRQRTGGARVIPVILRPCDWRMSVLGELAVVPPDGRPVTTWRNRDEAWLSVIGALRRVLPAGGDGAQGTSSRGLRTGGSVSP